MFNQWPYTNLHNLNLDWLLNQVQKNANAIERLVQNTESGNLTPRRYVILGDSYAEGIVIGGTYTNSWAMQLQTVLQTLGAQVYPCWAGGYGFSGAPDTNYFPNIYRDLNFSCPNPETITDVFLLAGRNDNGGEAVNIAAGIDAWVWETRNRFPNAKIYVGNISALDPFNYTWAKLTSREIDTVYQSAATRNMCTYIPYGYRVVRRSVYLSTDRIHPNQDGQNRLFAFALNSIAGYTFNSDESYDSSITSDANFEFSGSIHIECSGDVFSISIPINDAKQKAPFKFSDGVVKLFKIDDFGLIGDKNVRFAVQVYYTQNSLGVTGNCNLYIDNGWLYLEHGFGVDTSNDVTALFFNPCTISIVTA